MERLPGNADLFCHILLRQYNFLTTAEPEAPELTMYQIMLVVSATLPRLKKLEEKKETLRKRAQGSEAGE